MSEELPGPLGLASNDWLGPVLERWYVVSREGLATLCKDEADARRYAPECDRMYVRAAPHRAVLLGDVAAERDAVTAAQEELRLCQQDAIALQAENERLRAALKKANDRAEHFERLWYLTNEDAARYAFAKTLEGQVVTMETFKVRGAAEFDQAIDDAMMEAADAKNEAGYGA